MIYLIKLLFLGIKRHPNLSRGKLSIFLILVYCVASYYFIHNTIKILLNSIISNLQISETKIVIDLLVLILFLIVIKVKYFTVLETKFISLERFPRIKNKLIYINLLNSFFSFKLYFVTIILLELFIHSYKFNHPDDFIIKYSVILVFNYLIFFKISIFLNSVFRKHLFLTLIFNVLITISYFGNYPKFKEFQFIFVFFSIFFWLSILFFILKIENLNFPRTSNKTHYKNNSLINFKNKLTPIFFLYLNLFIRNKKLHNQFFTCIAIIFFYFYIFLFKQNIIQSTLLKLFILNTIFLIVPYTVLNNLISSESSFINKLFVLPNFNFYFLIVFTFNLIFSFFLFIILFFIQIYHSREYFEILSIFMFDSTIGMFLGFLIIFSKHKKIYLSENLGMSFDLVDYNKTLKLVFYFFVIYLFQILTIGVFSILYYKYFLFLLGLGSLFCVNYSLIKLSKMYLHYYKYSFINNSNKL